MSGHTRGPWRQREHEPMFVEAHENDNADICRLLWLGDEKEANARLICAAPDLLHAAVWLLNAESREELSLGDVVDADLALRAAIAKAKGLEDWEPVGQMGVGS